MAEPAQTYDCPKCHHPRYLLSELRGSSGGFTAWMNLDTQILTMVVCQRCRYTELYQLSKEEFRKRHGTACEVS